MKGKPKVGEVGEIRLVVEPQYAIELANASLPPVLATPWVIWFLEQAARQVLLPLLDANETSVGVHVDVQHLAPTPLGHTVVCRARVIHVDGRSVSFQVEARDERELIARGVHKRSVLDAGRFAKRIRRKAERT